MATCGTHQRLLEQRGGHLPAPTVCPAFRGGVEAKLSWWEEFSGTVAPARGSRPSRLRARIQFRKWFCGFRKWDLQSLRIPALASLDLLLGGVVGCLPAPRATGAPCGRFQPHSEPSALPSVGRVLSRADSVLYFASSWRSEPGSTARPRPARRFEQSFDAAGRQFTCRRGHRRAAGRMGSRAAGRHPELA